MSNPDEVMVELQLLVNRLKDAIRYLDSSVAECMRLPEAEEAVVRADASQAVGEATELLQSMVPTYEEAAENDPFEIG
jgi:hypothetical protein